MNVLSALHALRHVRARLVSYSGVVYLIPNARDKNRTSTIRHENITYPKNNIFELFSDYRFTISISSNEF